MKLVLIISNLLFTKGFYRQNNSVLQEFLEKEFPQSLAKDQIFIFIWKGSKKL